MRHLIEVFRSGEDAGVIARVPDLPGCNAWGATAVGAVHEVRDAAAAWIEACRAGGESVPEARIRAREPA